MRKKNLKVYNNKIVIINNDKEQEQPKEPEVEEIIPIVEIPKLPVTGM